MSEKNVLDYLIIGAGPAGLQMAYLLQNAKRTYVLLEGGKSAGSFFVNYPRHRRLISINKRFNHFSDPDYNMRHDWNSLLTNDNSMLFKQYSDELYPHADAIVKYCSDFAKKFKLNIQYQTRVEKISKEGAVFCVTDQKGKKYYANNVFLATGAVKPWIQPFPGVELAKTYPQYVVDPKYYENKRVLILGTGNTAFEIANDIAGHAAVVRLLESPTSPMKLAWQTHYVGDLRAINNTFLDMVQLKSMHFVLKGQIENIKKAANGKLEVLYREQKYAEKTDSDTWLKLIFDEVIIATGWRFIPDIEFDATCQPKMDSMQKFFELDSSWQTSVPGLYCLGTSMQQVERKTALGFIHGFRYAVRTLYHLLENRNFNQPLPQVIVDPTNQNAFNEFIEFLLMRLSTTSALYQLYGYACDVLVFEKDRWYFYPELTRPFVMANPQLFSPSAKVILMSFQYGFDQFYSGSDTLKFTYISTPPAYLHPVFEYYVEGELHSLHRIDESLLVRYVPEEGEPWDGNYARIRILLAQYLAKILNVDVKIRRDYEMVEGYYITLPKGSYGLETMT